MTELVIVSWGLFGSHMITICYDMWTDNRGKQPKLNPYSAWTVFIRQNVTSADVTFWRIKTVPHWNKIVLMTVFADYDYFAFLFLFCTLLCNWDFLCNSNWKWKCMYYFSIGMYVKVKTNHESLLTSSKQLLTWSKQTPAYPGRGP